MCLAIPMRLVEHDALVGIAELDGVRREVALMLLPEPPEVGDHLLVHAGYAIGKVDAEEAEASLALLREVADDGVARWDTGPSLAPRTASSD